MMYKCFDNDTLDVTLSRPKEKGDLILSISSDYSNSPRKQQLFVNEKDFSKMIEDTWKAIKTKMLLNMSISFDEIDWYDDMTDMYSTPIFSMERGLRKARVGYADHGSIPKDWSIDCRCRIKNTNVLLPVMDVVKNVLGEKFDKGFQDRFQRLIRPVLQGKKNSVTVPKELRV